MVPTWFSSAAFLALATLAEAHLGHHTSHTARRLASRVASPEESTWWHRDEQHFAHKLFKRGPATDGITYPEVGSPTWSSAYPTSTPDSNAMPQEWKDALAAAVQAGKIPNVPLTTADPVLGPVYPSGVDPMSPNVCSTTPKCRLDKDIIWDAPDGQIGVSFDDGPIAGSSDVLYTFLQENNIKVTHFFIGVYIVSAPKEFMTAFAVNEDDIAVHTWTHPYMTTLKNEDVVAQLGYTMEVIHNSTGGRIPRFWRPPYGDSDIRVNAIAREVFGLKTVIWNQDTEDWSMATTDLTVSSVENSLKGWYAGPKSPGLIILEHELTNDTVGAFINTWPAAVQAGWKGVSVAQLDGQNAPYQNAQGTTGQPSVEDVVLELSSSSSSTSLSVSTTISVNNNAAKTSSAASLAPSTNSAAATSNSTSSGSTTHSGATRFEVSSMFAVLSMLVMSAIVATL